LHPCGSTTHTVGAWRRQRASFVVTWHQSVRGEPRDRSPRGRPARVKRWRGIRLGGPPRVIERTELALGPGPGGKGRPARPHPPQPPPRALGHGKHREKGLGGSRDLHLRRLPGPHDLDQAVGPGVGLGINAQVEARPPHPLRRSRRSHSSGWWRRQRPWEEGGRTLGRRSP
jgi:hypothetical protein